VKGEELAGHTSHLLLTSMMCMMLPAMRLDTGARRFGVPVPHCQSLFHAPEWLQQLIS
jgi:hypothetical protein